MAIRVGNLYSIVRSYALKGMLLDQAFYEDLAGSRSLEELVDKLRPTPYGPAVAELHHPLTSGALERAFTSNLIDVEYSLLRAIPKPGALEAYFRRHIYRNVKTVLKAKAAERPHEEVSATLNLRAEEHLGIRDLVVKALAEKGVAEAAAALKGTPMEEEALNAVEFYEREKDLLVFDTSLDRAFYRQLLHSLRKMKRDERKALEPLIAPEVDGYLVIASLRSRLWRLTPAETRRFLLNEGVKLRKKDVEAMAQASTIQEVLAALKETEYEEVLRGLETEPPLRAVIDVEKWFRERVLREARKAFLRSVFRLAVVYAFFRLREEEVKNLSAIAFGIERGLPPSEILEEVSRVV